MLARAEPSMVQRRSISNKYLLARRRSSSFAIRVGMRSPVYSTIMSPLPIGTVANRPRPVRARAMRNGLSSRAPIAASCLPLALDGAPLRLRATFLRAPQFARALRPPPPATRALAARLADDVLQVINAVVVRQ